MKVYDEKMGNIRNMLQRGFYGSDIRFINLSEWVMVFFGLLFVLDMDKFLSYINPLKQIVDNQDFKLYEVFIVMVFTIIVLRIINRLAKGIFYKYLYLQPLKHEELSK